MKKFILTTLVIGTLSNFAGAQALPLVTAKEQLKRSLGREAYTLTKAETILKLNKKITYTAMQTEWNDPGMSATINLPKQRLELVVKLDLSEVEPEDLIESDKDTSTEVINLIKTNNLAEKRYFSECRHKIKVIDQYDTLMRPFDSESQADFQNRINGLKNAGVQFKLEGDDLLANTIGSIGFISCRLENLELLNAKTGQIVKVKKELKKTLTQDTSGENEEDSHYFLFSAGKNISVQHPIGFAEKQLPTDELGADKMHFFSIDKETFLSEDYENAEPWSSQEYKFSIQGINKVK